MMDDIITELNKVNMQLEDYFLESGYDNHEGFNKLITVDFYDPKLREALILMHNKYSAEIETLRKHHFKYLSKIVHINKNGYKKIIDIRNDLVKTLEEKEKNKVRVPKIVITVVSLVFLLGSLFYMFTIDKEAGMMISDIIKHGFQAVISYGKE